LPVLTGLRARLDIDLQTRPGGPDNLEGPHDYRYAATALVATCLGKPTDPATELKTEDHERTAYEKYVRLGPEPCLRDPWR
jgi:hypothetical protein